jgi:serine/threonine protein kinase
MLHIGIKNLLVETTCCCRSSSAFSALQFFVSLYSLGDVPVAVKVVDLERRGAHKMLKELATEHAVLCHLQPLWGSDVPRVMGYGMCSDLPFRVLILELVVGTWLDAHSPKMVRQSAVDALKRIHEVRVMHGDIRTENILVTKDLRVVFLDFGFAKIDSNKEEREAELSSLQEMLNIDC